MKFEINEVNRFLHKRNLLDIESENFGVNDNSKLIFNDYFTKDGNSIENYQKF